MLRLFLSLFLILATTTASLGQLSKAKLYALDQSLRQELGAYGSKVGLCLIDLSTGTELRINAQKKFPAASVAKVPVMATAYHLAESGKLNFEEIIVIKPDDKQPGSGIISRTRSEQAYPVKNLVRLMITVSDNTAAKALVDKMGRAYINNYLLRLGLKSTQIADATMLKTSAQQNINLTSPEDMARLFCMLKSKKRFGPKSQAEMLTYMKRQRYRWGIPSGLPRGIRVANKTGTLNQIVNDVGLVYGSNGAYVLAIFTQGISSQTKAKRLIRNLSQKIYQHYTSN